MNLLKTILFLSLSYFFSISAYSQIHFSRNDNLIVLNANGDTLKNAWAGGFNSIQFSEIDLDLDGTMDLLAFDKNDNRIIPFINSGIANQSDYKHAPEYIDNFPVLHDWVLLRDYNCDGKMDIFTYSSGGMAVYKNTSTTSLTFVKMVDLLYSDFQPNYINLYVSSQDIPAIDDIDGDGDLDILTFSIAGSIVEYHKNLSIETYGTCDSLNYQIRNKCWGFFHENLSSNSVTLDDTCQWNLPNPEKISEGNKHSGSTLLTLDVDANNSKELILGDVSFNNLTLLINGDNSLNLDKPYITAQDGTFPKNNNNTTAADINIFPAAYYLDINNDNVKDLIVAPNCQQGCANSKNTWAYQNNNATNNPDFTLTTNSFLQEEMIETGEGSTPVFFDYNADGLLDIVIGSYGDYNLNYSSGYKSSLWLYQNIGTATVPAYQLVDSDYVNISTMNLDLIGNQPALRIVPTFGDLDGDNDLDMIIGDYQGYLHYFINNGGAGNTASFSLSTVQYEGIDVGNFASPQLIDLNKDNLLDLVIGKKDGYISYYNNTGSITNPQFSFVTDSLGYVKTRTYIETSIGNSTPFFYLDTTGHFNLIAGAKNGNLYTYNNIDGNLGGTFNLIDSTFLDIWEGKSSFINLADVTNDGKLDMLVGNHSGGAVFYIGDIYTSVKNNFNQIKNIIFFPNPTQNKININLLDNDFQNSNINVFNILGDIIFSKMIKTQQLTIDLSSESNGIYFIKFSNNKGVKTFKVIKN